MGKRHYSATKVWPVKQYGEPSQFYVNLFLFILQWSVNLDFPCLYNYKNNIEKQIRKLRHKDIFLVRYYPKYLNIIILKDSFTKKIQISEYLESRISEYPVLHQQTFTLKILKWNTKKSISGTRKRIEKPYNFYLIIFLPSSM